MDIPSESPHFEATNAETDLSNGILAPVQPVVTAQNVRSMQTKSRSGISKPKVPYVGLANGTVSTETEPTSVTAALNSPLWKQAMVEEFEALKRNATWTLVPWR